jgi:hypothetical protein
MVGWGQWLGEGFEIGREALVEVEVSGGVIVTKHADAELGGTRLAGVAFSSVEQRTANAKPAMTGADHEFGDQRAIARRFVERLEWNTREHHDETNDRVGVLCDKNSSRVLSTTGMHLSKVLVRHRLPSAEARIKLSLCVLELDNTGATGVAVGVLVLTNCRGNNIAHKHKLCGNQRR